MSILIKTNNFIKTLKSKREYYGKNIEGILDVVVFRRLGNDTAIMCKNIGITPNTVTLFSTIIGLAAGHLFYYPNLQLNILGIVLWLMSYTLDFTDGQLARMTKNYSKFGRIFDGMSDNIRVLAVYIHICLRIQNETGSPWIWLIAFLSAYSHSLQCAMVDYYRSAYVFFVTKPDEDVDLSISAGGKRGGIDKSKNLKAAFKKLIWKNDFFDKLLSLTYISYTTTQEKISPSYVKLVTLFDERFQGNLPDWLRKQYGLLNLPLLWYYKILMMNTRMIVLFICLFLDLMPWFFYFQLTILNILLLIALVKQNRVNHKLIAAIESTT